MKIVITDAQTVFDEIVTAAPIYELGETKEFGLLKYDDVAESIKDAEVILCNKTVLDKNSLRLAKNLKYIGLFATGYNNIDIEYCRENGIAVCNAGSYSTNAVAQHTFALILEHFNNTAKYGKYVSDGKWKRSKTFSPFVYPLNELAGKTIGIVGLGSIGTAVAKIANAFEMKVIAYNRSQKNVEGVTQTDKAAFEKMKRSALFVNTARGGVMVEQDLYRALKDGKIGGACIDTLAVEPMVEDCILMDAPNCIITPHIAWAPVETRQRLIDIVVENIKSFYRGERLNRVV